MKEKTVATKPKQKPDLKAAPFPYYDGLNSGVKKHLHAAMDLSKFLAAAPKLSPEQRKLIVEQALVLMEQNYAHLPLKKAMHAIDPVQRLKLLLQSLESSPTNPALSDTEFHREMTEIFTSVRDLHTNYLLPEPYSSKIAFLPFLVEDYFEGGVRKYVVTRLGQGFNPAAFVPGVEILYWNGVPIERAVANNASRYAGSNREARHARGVETLTTRALSIALPPDEEWVTVGYKTAEGKLEEIRVGWLVFTITPQAPEPQASAALGLDLEQNLIQQMRKILFAPQVIEAEKKIAGGGQLQGLESTMPAVFEAKEVVTPTGKYGHLRIRTFDVWPPADFLAEFLRLITALPQNGLIIDVRGNGGGVINNGEFLLQTLTPKTIEPEPLQFFNTPLNLAICRHNGPQSNWADLSPWVESMQQALQTGATYSAGFPISDPELCNFLGQKYFGPVVLIVDALCYSTTDIFAAGFQDHEIGPILGAAGNTGAGGANVWEQRFFVSHVLPGSAYKELPNGAGMRISIRRTLRVKRRAGTPVEDLGVIPDERHYMTYQDLLHGNVDLINKAGALLAALPVRSLVLKEQSVSAAQANLSVLTEGMSRLDIYLNERPIQSIDVQAGQTELIIARTDAAPLDLEIRGYAGKQLVARYRHHIK